MTAAGKRRGEGLCRLQSRSSRVPLFNKPSCVVHTVHKSHVLNRFFDAWIIYQQRGPIKVVSIEDQKFVRSESPWPTTAVRGSQCSLPTFLMIRIRSSNRCSYLSLCTPSSSSYLSLCVSSSRVCLFSSCRSTSWNSSSILRIVSPV